MMKTFEPELPSHTEAKFPAGSVLLESMGCTWPHSE